MAAVQRSAYGLLIKKMETQSGQGIQLAREGVKARGRLACGEVMSAVNAEDVGDAGAAIAVAATCRDLIGALRTVVVVAFDMSSAGGASGCDGLTKQEVKHGADSSGHDDAEHPQSSAHAAAGRIVADVADHEHIEGSQGSPGNNEVETKRNGDAARMMAVSGDHNPEIVLGEDEGQERSGNGPAGNETKLIGEACFGLRIASLCEIAHRSLLSRYSSPGFAHAAYFRSGFFSVARAAAPQVNDQSREDCREECGDDRHGHRRHVLKMLAIEQIVGDTPECRCK